MNSVFVLNDQYETKNTLQIPSGVIDLTISKNLLAVNSFTNNIYIYDINDLEKVMKKIEVNPCDSWKLKFSNDNNKLYTGGASGILFSYDVKNEKEQ